MLHQSLILMILVLTRKRILWSSFKVLESSLQAPGEIRDQQVYLTMNMQTTIVIHVTRQCKSGPNILSIASYILVGVQAYSTGRNRFLVLKSLPCGYFPLSSLKTSNHIPAFTKLEETGKCILPYQVKERKQRSKLVSHHTQESTKFEILQELEPPVIE